MPVEYSPYLFIFVLAVAAVLFALTPLGLAWLWAKKFSPRKPGPGKNAIYECGLESKGDAWVQFKAQYYIFALVFLVFDVEAIFLFPWALLLKRLPLYVVLEGILFILILVAGLVYVWRKRMLEWI